MNRAAKKGKAIIDHLWVRQKRRSKRCITRRFVLISLIAIAFIYSFESSIASVISLSATRGHVWRVYFSTDSSTWDDVHGSTSAGNDNEGGIWNYSPEKIATQGSVGYLLNRRMKFYEESIASGNFPSGEISVWDASCNVGYFLKVLHSLEKSPMYVLNQMLSGKDTPEPEPSESGIAYTYYGTDISEVMIEKTKSNCPTCITAQFDLGLLKEDSWAKSAKSDERKDMIFKFGENGNLRPITSQSNDGPIRRIADDFPPAFHFVLVSDVLIYISWGGYMPLLLQKCALCRRNENVIREQRNLIENLRSITYNEIIVSDHQMNPQVVDMMGVFVEEGIAQWMADYSVWIIPGIASQLD